MRVLHTLNNNEVKKMRVKLLESLSADLDVGALVRITGGNYRDLEGVVVDLYPRQVAVKIEFRSLTSIVVVPRNLATFASAELPKPLNFEPDDEPVSLDELLENMGDGS